MTCSPEPAAPPGRGSSARTVAALPGMVGRWRHAGGGSGRGATAVPSPAGRAAVAGAGPGGVDGAAARRGRPGRQTFPASAGPAEGCDRRPTAWKGHSPCRSTPLSGHTGEPRPQRGTPPRSRQINGSAPEEPVVARVRLRNGIHHHDAAPGRATCMTGQTPPAALLTTMLD
jgi:hypothetical protein